MGSRKGKEGKKGKQPAKRTPIKRPATLAPSSDDKEKTFDRQAILAQIALLERVQASAPPLGAIGLSLAPSTRKEYRRIVHHFDFFWKVSSYSTCWPILVEQLLYFGVSLREAGLSVGSICAGGLG